MKLQNVFSYGAIVALDEEFGLLVTVNGAYFNLWVGAGDNWENTDCRRPSDPDNLMELSLYDAVEYASRWLDEVRSGDEQ